MNNKTLEIKKKFDTINGNPNQTFKKNNRKLIDKVDPQLTMHHKNVVNLSGKTPQMLN